MTQKAVSSNLRFCLGRSKSYSYVRSSPTTLSTQVELGCSPHEISCSDTLGISVLTTRYFEWCPEAVVIVNAWSKCIITVNTAFQNSITTAASIVGSNVLHTIFPPSARPHVSLAVDSAFAGAEHVVQSCPTLTHPEAERPHEARFDWAVKRTGSVIVLSGRPAAADACGHRTLWPSPHAPDVHSRRHSVHSVADGSAAALDSILGPPTPPASSCSACGVDDLAGRVREARGAAELRACKEQLQQKDTFMQKIFHEIRTPCHSLQMLTKLLLDMVQGDPAVQAHLETAWAQSVHICKLADDVKHALQLLSGEEPKVCKAWFPLQSPLSEVQALVQKLYPASPVPINVVLRDTVPQGVHVHADPELLSSVLRHLLTNAVKFADRGPVVLEVQCLPSPGGLPPRLCFSVTNTGPQISLAVVYQMGQRYWQQQGPGGDALLRQSCGFGLGLHLAFNYVRMMGGQLQVRSTKSQTMFFFTIDAEMEAGGEAGAGLPDDHPRPRPIAASATSTSSLTLAFHAGLPPASSSGEQSITPSPSPSGVGLSTSLMPLARAESPSHARTPDPSSSSCRRRWRCLLPWARHRSPSPSPGRHSDAALRSPQSPPTTAPPHVLVVEDNMVCQRVVCKCLERGGLRYTVAGNGQAACDMVAAAPDQFDAVLMDLRMPVMDGVAATRRLRHDLQCTMPIIVFSAEVGEATLGEAARAGATDFLPKPATPQMVMDMLRKHCPTVPHP